MDHYSTLGINKNASQDEIKKAYRSLASKHHPDKGGDTAKFQEIQTAYATLSDPEKRSQYDNPQPQGFQPFGGMPPGFEDVFSQAFGQGFGDIFGRGRSAPPARNKTLNIQTTITLEDAFNGKELIATLTLPSGREQIIEVRIPAGVQDGVSLRLAGMGDDSFSNMPRGDIHLTVNVSAHNKFQRQGDDLISEIEVNCIDAILGKKILINTIDNKLLELSVHPGTQHGQIMAASGYGMPNMRDNKVKGRLLIAVKIKIPTNLTDVQKQLLKEHFQ
jgi:DnaJ-class molecular chaperone